MGLTSLSIDKRSPFSIQRQLATQLLHLIRSGSLKPGERLPTVRELAGYLRINHNTVALAYRELEAQGLVRVEQGRGTFVTEAAVAPDADRHAAAAAAIREAFERCRALGVTVEEFLEAAAAVAQLGAPAAAPAVHLLLVECNGSDLDWIAEVLAPEIPARLSRALVEDLGRRAAGGPEGAAGGREGLADVDLVVTTFFHVNEVEALLDGAQVKVAGLYMGASIRTLMRIMALPASARIAAVGASAACARGLAASLRNALDPERPLAVGHVLDPDTLPAVVGDADVVVYPETVRAAVEPFLPTSVERIVVEKQIDRGSIEMLKELVALVARRKGAAAGSGG
ncbi:MAG TPA: GntR family transcriptional regulator [Thermodesulfobacteriota bacterium]|nr:GntR family transcriptional regulator [Thermodesulfobacteriota bacterium]